MKIGLLGYGTVGKGAYDVLQEHSGVEVAYVLDQRELPELEGCSVRVTKDIREILDDPTVDLVIELIGGMHPAYEFVEASLKAKKHVVTANKLMVSANYGRLLDLARENGVILRYSAAAGGGIPWLINLSRAHRASTLQSVFGIMNGTTNYILDAMLTSGKEFSVALAEAQKLGFAEADPSSDIDGLDTRHKTTLSANIAFGVTVEDDDVDAFGIRTVNAGDVMDAKEHGYTLKLIGKAVCREGKISAWVEPTFVSMSSPEGNIRGCDNIIGFEGTYIGKTMFIGAGAGRYPTGYAVAQDCLDLLEGHVGMYNEKTEKTNLHNEIERHSYYVRTDYSNAFFASLPKTSFGQGVKVENISVREMHDFAKEALAAGKTVFFAGFSKD